MHEKDTIPVDLLDSAKPVPLIEAWFEIVHLKQLFRQGWLRRGLDTADCETVAEHTFGTAMLCLMLLDQRPELDPLKVLKLALLHDIGEVYVGDITPHDRVDGGEKRRLEAEAAQKILGKLSGGAALLRNWHEYETKASPEAQFVKEIDQLEMALQSAVYELQGKIAGEEFRTSAARHVVSEDLKAVLDAVVKLTKRGA